MADAKGNAATIEFFDGKMKVHSGKDMPFPVLTNNAYASVLNQGRVAVSAPSIDYLSFNDNSINRFAKACYMVKQFQETDISMPVIDYSFSILDKVAQGTHTKWSIVYDITNKKSISNHSVFRKLNTLNFQSLTLPALQQQKPGK